MSLRIATSCDIEFFPHTDSVFILTLQKYTFSSIFHQINLFSLTLRLNNKHVKSCHKTHKTYKTILWRGRLRNRVAAGKPPFRIKFGMRGRLSLTKKKGFVGFCKFCDKKTQLL